MNFSLIESHIAWRYLFSKKGHNAINIVSGISAAAVVVVTAAMICVLSVMNGFGSLVEQMFSEFDPPLLVVPEEGQTLRTDTAPVVSLYAREDIQAVSMQLEQTALVRYKDHQLPARVLGVDTLFEATANMSNIITDGFFSVWPISPGHCTCMRRSEQDGSICFVPINRCSTSMRLLPVRSL